MGLGFNFLSDRKDEMARKDHCFRVVLVRSFFHFRHWSFHLSFFGLGGDSLLNLGITLWRPGRCVNQKGFVVKVRTAEKHPAGLNRLRKNYDSQARLKEDIPQGLKPAAVLLRLRHD